MRLWRIDAGEPDLVLDAVAIQNSHRIAVRDPDHTPSKYVGPNPEAARCQHHQDDETLHGVRILHFGAEACLDS
jgi:hypothetical protein